MNFNNKILEFKNNSSLVFLSLPIFSGMLAFSVSLLVEIQALLKLTNSIFLIYSAIAMEIGKVSLIFLNAKSLLVKTFKYLFMYTFFAVSFFCSLTLFGDHMTYENLSKVLQGEKNIIHNHYNEKISQLEKTKERLEEYAKFSDNTITNRLKKRIDDVGKDIVSEKANVQNNHWYGTGMEQVLKLEDNTFEKIAKSNQFILKNNEALQKISDQIAQLQKEKQEKLLEITTKNRVSDDRTKNEFLKTFLAIVKNAFEVDMNYYQVVFYVTLLLALALEFTIYLSTVFVKLHIAERKKDD